MSCIREITGPLALTLIALGGLLFVVGAEVLGKRCLLAGVALLVAAPLLEGGVSALARLGAEHLPGVRLDSVALALGAAAVLLAGLVAWRRSVRRKSDATSLKRRVDE